MLEIQRLRLQLPSAFEHRGRRISTLVARQLELPAGSGPVRIDRLQVGPVHVEAGHSDAQVARAIARAIRSSLDSHPATGGRA